MAGPDLSNMSDADLLALTKGSAPAAPSNGGPDLGHLSDEDLLKLSGKSKSPKISDMAGDMLKEQSGDVDPKAMSARWTGFGQGLTLGLLPHLQAAAEPALAKIYDTFTGDHVSDDIKPNYVDRRDDNIKRIEKQKNDYPVSYGGGNLSGGLAMGMAASPLAPALAEGAGLGSRILQGAKIGAGFGAASNPGDTEGEISPLQLSDRAVNTAKGAAIGAGSVPVVEGVLAGANAIGNKLKGTAETQAFKALGPYARDVKKAYAKDDIQNIGRTALDEGILGGFKPISQDTIATNAENALGNKGDQLQKYLESLASNGEQSGVQSTLDRSQIGAQLRKKLINPNTDIPGVAAKNDQMEALIQQFEAGKQNMIPMLEAENLKRSVGKEINWDRLPGADIPTQEQAQRALYGELKGGVENAAEGAERNIGPQDGSKFGDLKQDYGNLQTAANISGNRTAREMANRFISPSDYMSGSAGAIGGMAMGMAHGAPIEGAVLGAGLGLVNKVARTYGNQINAKSLDTVSQMLMKSPEMARVAQQNPAAFQSLVNNLASKMSGSNFQSNPNNFDSSGDSQKLSGSGHYDPKDQHPEPIENGKQKFLEGN